MFPYEAADELIRALTQASVLLDRAMTARANKRGLLTDFQGVYADRYRASMDAEETAVADLVAALRSWRGAVQDGMDRASASPVAAD